MAENNAPVNAGEQITDTPPNLPVSQEAQFRIVNQRLDTLSKDFEKLAKPPTFRIADVVSLLVIVLGLAATGFTALGLSERIRDLNVNIGQAEQRLNSNMSAIELRLQAQLDKLGTQFTSMNERLSRIEGANDARPSK
jgi:hypothetical protein